MKVIKVIIASNIPLPILPNPQAKAVIVSPSTFSASKKTCASRHRPEQPYFDWNDADPAQDFKVLNGCDWVNGKSGATPGSAAHPCLHVLQIVRFEEERSGLESNQASLPALPGVSAESFTRHQNLALRPEAHSGG
jgi:hypothetical protein